MVKQYREMINKFGSNKIQAIYDLLEKHKLLDFHTAKKENVFECYDAVKDLFETYYKKAHKKRYIDFNQGIDARLINDKNMEKLSEIPVRPIRIAFDNWKIHKTYENAVKTAVKHGHRDLSNYLLYNYEDTPIELYKRLKLNVDLCDELGASIYSFPMKYHPIEDPNYFSNRDYIGIHWNRKFIRTIQAVLNSTKGKVGKGHSFFCKAFGATEEEFNELLYMPEALIIYRLHFEGNGITQCWREAFNALSQSQLAIIKPIVEANDFSNIENATSDKQILNVLKFYTIKRHDAEIELNKDV